MTTLRRTILRRAPAALALAWCSPWVLAQDSTPIRVLLDSKLQGVHAGCALTRDRACVAQEQIDPAIDQGDGSAGAITAVLVGSGQAVCGDLNVLVLP